MIGLGLLLALELLLVLELLLNLIVLLQQPVQHQFILVFELNQRLNLFSVAHGTIDSNLRVLVLQGVGRYVLDVLVAFRAFVELLEVAPVLLHGLPFDVLLVPKFVALCLQNRDLAFLALDLPLLPMDLFLQLLQGLVSVLHAVIVVAEGHLQDAYHFCFVLRGVFFKPCRVYAAPDHLFYHEFKPFSIIVFLDFVDIKRGE